MALTEAQRVSVRFYLGWSERFHQFDSRLEQAMNALASHPDSEAIILDTLENGGILASLEDIDAKLVTAHKRIKASQVGSIKLNEREIKQLCKEGRRFAGRLASLLGVEIRHDVFSDRGPRTFAGHGGMYSDGGGNYVGK